MEYRKENMFTMKLCRFCLTTSEPLLSLYERKAPKDPVPLSLKILSCVGIEVYPSNRMPQYICQQCKFFMELTFSYKNICRQADENISQYIQQGKHISPISWSGALKKVFKSSNKGVPADVGMVETVTTQSGATIQVMAEEISDDEEEGENDDVYNVKVADGPEEGKRIKIVTTDKPEAKKRNRKDSEEEIVEPRLIKTEGNGCWPCDECDCNYPLEQLLVLHKAQKHRDRLVHCEECDAKVYLKDLVLHQSIHEPNLPFECASCGSKFKTFQLLKRHEKVMHPDIPQKECNRCPAKFLTCEELETHKLRHVISMERPYWCKICDKRFHDKSVLIKHQEFVHKKKPEFSCQYCPEQFSTVSKLTRHLKAHAGERPYPCKHCNKSFIKSHHYTRHLRVKHSNIRNQTGTEDPYRCEECEETFSTQDELMYHSALHATRNLVCPLCQEKFEDVDTVTAHIKSHVNGNEFMCDFCELIFTSKEKLENHVASAHEDELTNDQEMEQDESSMEMDAEEDDDDNSINVKEEDGHMVVEINKAEQFMLRSQDDEEKNDNTQSEDSEIEAPYEPPVPKRTNLKTPNKIVTPEVQTEPQVLATVQKLPVSTSVAKPADSSEKAAPSILKKVEEMKRQVIEQQTTTTLEKSIEKKSNNNNKVESSTSATGASEKSLRLLEKELQDLKRTNTRNEATKTPAKPLENLRKRPVIHTSTPKTRTAEKREVQQTKPVEKQVVPEKKSERRSVTQKDTKESISKETKESKGNSVREEKIDKDNTKEEVTKVDKKELKEKEKAIVKNGVSEKPQEETIRRSTRPSKVKDYAKMIRDNRSSSEEDSEEESYEDDSKDTDKSTETPPQPRGRPRKSLTKTPATPAAAPAPTPVKAAVATPASAPKKRGRPRKIQNQEPTPAKIRKGESTDDKEQSETAEVAKLKTDASSSSLPPAELPEVKDEVPEEKNEQSESPKPTENSCVMMSPSGQTLKKVPIKALPPGVKPMPLPRQPTARGTSEVCEMQIGKKVVKVQKIVMTKAEVEEMTKKGLVEMKDGTMVLKQGIKLPGNDPTSIKSSIMAEGEKKQESLKKE